MKTDTPLAAWMVANRHSNQTLADLVGEEMQGFCSPRAVEKWRLGTAAPRARQLVALVAVTGLPAESFVVERA